MPLKYNPKDAVSCLPEGDYDAVLEVVEDKTSKAGNPMQVAHWKIFGDNRTIMVKDFITNPQTLFRLRHIAKVMGKEPEFNKGTFQLDDQIGTRIKVKLAVEEQEGFDDKNRIHAYMSVNGSAKKSLPAKTPGEPDDSDIPF